MSVDPTRVAVRDEVVARLDEIAARVTAEIVAEIPAYAALAPPQLAEVDAIARWGTTRVLDLWAEGAAGLTASDVHRFRGIGAARALDGRPLPGILRAYRLAATQVVDHIEATAADRLTVADAIALSRLWMAVVDTLTDALHEGYAAGTQRAGDRDGAIEGLLDDLLAGRQVARTNLEDRGRALRVAIPPRPTLLVVALAPDGPSRTDLAALVGDDAPLRHRDGHGVALLDTDAARVSARWDASWRGALVPNDRVTDLPRTFRLATHALEHAPSRAYGAGRLLDEADVLLVALLTGHPDTDHARFARLVLDGLDDHLLASIEAHVATGSADAAAARLGVHPQTLRHRLRRTRELSGRDPRRTWDRLVLEVALLGRSA
ncbi:helix-turn-helix domain-containing protein [Nocardioides zeae]|uniref:PucR family transcriptional regulator n=1 Tax=Nocardioides zeae TaxID=1457234 RepID=A0A6P0HKM7_9ACTN|nr:helix-turn-helix domain-containing protein [Nocardioides zeae]NEN79136.1 PucR family transcriptional regulator [Nocardioides zeae]